MDENGQFVLVADSARDKDWDQLVDLSNAAISPEQYYKAAGKPSFNPAEPWTGVWEVEGSARFAGNTWGMKQNGRTVKSTKESTFKFDGKIRGNQLEGKIEADSSILTRFSVKMSQDHQTFEGSIIITSQSSPIKGKRKK